MVMFVMSVGNVTESGIAKKDNISIHNTYV